MPVALLLQESFSGLHRGARGLALWNQIVAIEELLVGRARTAFLVHWYGTRLPLEGLSLRIAIDNLQDLRRRFQEVRAAAPALTSGPNLLEPLAGIAGSLAGILISPTGLLLVGSAVVPRSGSFLKGLLLALGFILGIGLLPILAMGALPISALSAIALVESGDELARNLYNLLGAAAEMLEAARAFVEQLLGPRSGVQNPLIRQVLEIFDRLAVLVPYFLALLALVIVYVGPLLGPLALQAQLLLALVDAVLGAITFIWDDFMRRLTALYEDPPAFMELEIVLGALVATSPPLLAAGLGFFQQLVTAVGGLLRGRPSPFTVLKSVFALLQSIPAVFKRGLKRLFGALGEDFGLRGTNAARLVTSWMNEVRAAFRTILLGHPLIVAMQTLRDEFRVISRVLGGAAGGSSSASAASGAAPSAPTPGTSPPPPSPTTTTTPSLARRIIGVPQLPNVAALEAALGGRPAGSYDPAAFGRAAAGLDLETLAPSLFLSDAAQRNIARLRQPVDVFAAERRRLVDAEGRTPAAQLAARRAEELPLRQALTDIVQRLFPPAVARYVPQLHALFERLDREIYGVQPPPSQAGTASPPAAAQTPELPVLQVPESNRLRPVVRQLHIQARSDDEPAVRAWTEQLRQALVAQSYAVEA